MNIIDLLYLVLVWLRRLNADTHIVTVARLIFISLKIENEHENENVGKRGKKCDALRDLTAIFSGIFQFDFCNNRLK